MTFLDPIITETKNICSISFKFCKFRYNFEDFEKKDDPHSIFIFGLTDFERRAYINF